MASVPLLSSPGRDPRSQKRAKDRAKRQPAHGQSVSGKHHSRLAAMPSPSVAPKLHPAALSPADVALFPTTISPGAAEGSEMWRTPRQVALKLRATLATRSAGFPPTPPRSTERARNA